MMNHKAQSNIQTGAQALTQNRNEVRSRYKKRRADMPPFLAELLSDRISKEVLSWECYQKAGAVFFYYPLGNEVSLLPVIEDALSKGKRAAFPKTVKDSMQFYEVTDLTEFSEGSFHVMEPDIKGKKPADWEPELCFVPGVVFDRQGGRFGYGKGYYDRYFAHKTCCLAGCAYECQTVDRLQTDAWDVRMNYLVTENGVFSV